MKIHPKMHWQQYTNAPKHTSKMQPKVYLKCIQRHCKWTQNTLARSKCIQNTFKMHLKYIQNVWKYIQKCTGNNAQMHPRMHPKCTQNAPKHTSKMQPKVYPKCIQRHCKWTQNTLAKIKVHPKYIQNAFKIYSKCMKIHPKMHWQQCTNAPKHTSKMQPKMVSEMHPKTL